MLRPSATMLDFVSHSVAGTVAGISSIIVGHPFDTIKVCVWQSIALRLVAATLQQDSVSR